MEYGQRLSCYRLLSRDALTYLVPCLDVLPVLGSGGLLSSRKNIYNLKYTYRYASLNDGDKF